MNDVIRWDVPEEFGSDATSIGSLHGSARGSRNVSARIRAMSRVGALSGDTLLDVGCGTGEYTVALLPNFATAVAADIEPTRLSVLRETAPPGLRTELMSANDLSLDPGSVDVVTMIEVLEHLSDPPGALREARRVLRPDGRLFITTPARRWPLEQHGVLIGGRRRPSVALPFLTWLPPLHRRHSDAAVFGPRSLRRLAEASGFRLGAVTFMLPPLDSLPEGHRVHAVLDRLDPLLSPWFGQTIVARLDPL